MAFSKLPVTGVIFAPHPSVLIVGELAPVGGDDVREVDSV